MLFRSCSELATEKAAFLRNTLSAPQPKQVSYSNLPANLTVFSV